MKEMYAVLTRSDKVVYGSFGEVLLFLTENLAEHKAAELNKRFATDYPVYKVKPVNVDITYDRPTIEKVDVFS